ncbi:MAG: glycerol-3-phosphate 1-O-acyltransferase PlsY, partial [Solobacterium sp.]|nr:glycerol-3-phosphate 1-O-acyltransferase PlsY [Solobacterium sp.]
HKDIRNEGSGKLGASNAGRDLGKPIAIIVTILDALKGFFSMLVAHYIAPGLEVYAGLACCIGHCFPIFAGFRGGKAVATSYGFLLGIVILLTKHYFLQFLLPILCFFLLLFLTKMVSLSSIGSLLISTIISLILSLSEQSNYAIPISLFCLWIFVTYRHKDNLKRIKEGTESKITWMG